MHRTNSVWSHCKIVMAFKTFSPLHVLLLQPCSSSSVPQGRLNCHKARLQRRYTNSWLKCCWVRVAFGNWRVLATRGQSTQGSGGLSVLFNSHKRPTVIEEYATENVYFFCTFHQVALYGLSTKKQKNTTSWAHQFDSMCSTQNTEHVQTHSQMQKSEQRETCYRHWRERT